MKSKKTVFTLLVIMALLIVGVTSVVVNAGDSGKLGDVETLDTGAGSEDVTNMGAPFTVNPNRYDPYKQFKFRVKWDGKYIPGISKVSGLIRTTEAIEFRDGGDPSNVHISPGTTLYEPIVLERGRTHDTEFEKWANKVWNFGSGLGSEVSLEDFRKDIIIELYNEAGQLVMAWKVYRCWPSEYIPVAGFDANNHDIAIESMTLQNEGWERDYEVTEPTEPSFTEPDD